MENFESSVQDLSSVEKIVSVTIPAEAIESEITASLKKLGSSANIKGFRPGKAPKELVAKLHGGRVRIEVVDRLINTSLNSVIKKNSFSLVGQATFDKLEMDPGKDIAYEARFSIFPKPELSNYKNLSVSVEKKEASKEEIDSVVSRIADSRATFKKIESRDVVNSGDLISGTVKVLVPGVDEDPKSEPFTAPVGNGELPKDLEEALPGTKLGVEKQIKAVMDSDHPNDLLKDKEVTFLVTINEIQEKVLPELNDEFVALLGGEEKTLLELRNRISTQLEQDFSRASDEEAKSKFVDLLVDKNDFEIPASLIDEEIRNLAVKKGNVGEEIKSLSDINPEDFRADFMDEATRRVKASVIVDRIAEVEKLHATTEEIQVHIQEFASSVRAPIDQVQKYFSDSGRMVELFVEATRKKVLNFLLSNGKVEYTAQAEPKPKSKSKSKKKTSS